MTRAHCAQPGYLAPVTISITPEGELFPGSFCIVQGDRICDGLGWDEMLGQVVALTHPRIRMPHYPMLTLAERRLEEARRELRMAERAVEEERNADASAPVQVTDFPDELSRVTKGAL